MGAAIAKFSKALVGRMGRNDSATMIVRLLRLQYLAYAGSIGVFWYSGWRNERVAPGDHSFPFPGASKLRKRFGPDRPDPTIPGGYSPTSGKAELSGPGLTAGTIGAAAVSGSAWGGTEAVCKSILHGLGLTVTSAKRQTQNSSSGLVSDHWVGCKLCYAEDVAPGPGGMSLDQAAQVIMRRLGGHYTGGPLVFTTIRNGFRIQVLYKTAGMGFGAEDAGTIIHVGVRKVGYNP